MEEENKPNIFNGASKIFIKSWDAPDSEYKELPIVENSVEYRTGYYDAPDMRKESPTYSLSCKIDDGEEFLKILEPHPMVQKCLNKAQKMLDEIQKEVKEFYHTDPPRNRKERRKRAKELEKKIRTFNAYCKDYGIELKNNS